MPPDGAHEAFVIATRRSKQNRPTATVRLH